MADGKQEEAIGPVRAYLEYFRDMGVYEFYRNGEPRGVELAVAEAEPVQVLPTPSVAVAEQPLQRLCNRRTRLVCWIWQEFLR